MKKNIKVLVLGMLLVTALSMAMVDTNINAMVGWRAAYTKVMNKKEGCNFALVL